MNTKYSILFIASSLFLFSCNDSSKESKKSEVNTLSSIDNAIVIKKGKEIAMSSFKVLSGDLKAAMKKGGPIAGVEVCSSKAMILSDSLSDVYGVKIKRTSLKIRNNKNSANTEEKQILNKWESSISEGKKISPEVLKHDDGSVVFVAPIKLKSLCLTCHGTSETLTPDLKTEILKHYPKDAAIGYKENDLRGAWSITFPKGYFDKE
ncbi:MAG: DUF3365 domain-containing protein [Flavobacteriales bacterium]|nr:DUF3365 domain-containing protein [Flavobacteriales bacterium]